MRKKYVKKVFSHVFLNRLYYQNQGYNCKSQIKKGKKNYFLGEYNCSTMKEKDQSCPFKSTTPPLSFNNCIDMR